MKPIQFLVSIGLLTILLSCSKKQPCKEISIPGTSVSLCPPADFELRPDQGGFHHRSLKASILVLEISQPFDVAQKELDPSKLADQGIAILSQETVSIGGSEGTLLAINKGAGNVTLQQWILLLPKGESSLTINGTFLQKDEKLFATAVKQALLTARLEQSLPDESILSFELDMGQTPLRLAKILQGPSVAYNERGIWPMKSPEEFSFFAGPSTVNPLLPHDKEIAMEQLNQLCKDCRYDKDSVKAVSIDDLSGYEIIAYSSKDSLGSDKVLKFQVLLFDENRYYLLIGTAPQNHKQNLELFKKVSSTFRRKRIQS